MPSPHRADPSVRDSRFTIGDGVVRAAEGCPYERQPGDPLDRPLRIFALDPSVPGLDGSVALTKVPFEPLEVGFCGHLFEMDLEDTAAGVTYQALSLDDRAVLLADGRKPSPADPLFHQQMVYAVCMLAYSAFRTALGRSIAWGFDRNGNGSHGTRLRLRPWGTADEANAHYDKERGELSFGYFKAPEAGRGPAPPGGLVFACLSHDIVTHEVTHALVDGLRSQFSVPSGPDVSAFHEGFADLVAVFQHFSFPTVVEAAIGKARGTLEDATLLSGIASEFGQVLGSPAGIRNAIDREGSLLYDPEGEPHALGSVLVSAVFDAFRTVYRRKVARYVRLATQGTGTLAPGDIPLELRALLAEEASKLARQFLRMAIRALDYCPPVDIELGEFLRAVLTADRELVPDDPFAYREAWVDAFRRRRIFPPGVRFLTEDTLVWEPPPRPLEAIRALTFAELRFAGDPGSAASARELERQARALGRFVTHPRNLELFGLAVEDDPRLDGDAVELPQVQSIRSSRRVGPDGQVVFDLVAEVTQVRHVRPSGDLPGFDFVGGATLIIGPDGRFRYVVCKDVLHERRLARQRAFIASDAGRAFWKERGGRLVPTAQPFKLMHR